MKTILRIFLGIIAAILLCMIIASVYVLTHITNELTVTSYSVDAGMVQPFRIVQLTDLHNAEFGDNNEQLVSLAAEQKPDIIVMTGDMLNEDDDNTAIVISLVKKMTDVTDVYFSMGNHEYKWIKTYGDCLIEELEEAGAVILDNSYLDVTVNENNVRIGGYMGYYNAPHMITSDEEQQDLERQFMVDFENTDRYKILLNHIATSWSDWGYLDIKPVDLVLCGHYHGGIIQFPIIHRGLYAPYIGWLPKNTKGEFSGQYGKCILSAGLGSEYPIPRINNPPEITVIDVY